MKVKAEGSSSFSKGTAVLMTIWLKEVWLGCLVCSVLDSNQSIAGALAAVPGLSWKNELPENLVHRARS
jgi:hypothetical protein